MVHSKNLSQTTPPPVDCWLFLDLAFEYSSNMIHIIHKDTNKLAI